MLVCAINMPSFSIIAKHQPYNKNNWTTKCDKEEWTLRGGGGTGGDAKSSSFLRLHVLGMKLTKTRLFNELQTKTTATFWMDRFLYYYSVIDRCWATKEEPPGIHQTTSTLLTGGVALRLDKSDMNMNVPVSTSSGRHYFFDLSNSRITLPIHRTAAAVAAALCYR